MNKKKISKVILAALMVSAIGASSVLPVFAANTVRDAGNNWVGSDYVDATHVGTAITTKKTITVTNVRDQKNGVANSATEIDVIAYQLVKGTYKDGKLTGYVLCDATNAPIADMENPTVSEITTIANNVRAGSTTLTGIHMTQGTGAQSTQYTADVEAGLYIVLASGANGYVYNPAVVAVNITDADDIVGTASGTSVDLATYWNIPANAYLKSSTTNFNKDIVSATRRNPGTAVTTKDTEGDIVSKGDIVAFKLNGMVIPDYTAEYANGVVYKIDDKLDDNSFAGIDSLVVKTNVGETDEATVVASYVDDKNTVDTGDDETVENYTVVYKDKDGNTVTGEDIATDAVSYTIQFTDAWLRANKTKTVEVTYNSNLTENAYVNGKANKSVATLSYTVDPSNNNGVEVLRDTTYHYTFEIGGQIDSTVGSTVDGDNTFHGYEINKVTEALASGAHYSADATTGEFSSAHALAGATFTLYDDEAMTQIRKLYKRNDTTKAWEYENAVYTTGSDGHIVFSGLDEGTYYMKETDAPDGYTLNDNDYKVVISGTIADGTGSEEQGTLTGYSVTIYQKDGASWTPCGSSTYTITPAVTKPTTDANAMNFDSVTNTISTNITPAEVVDTQLATLPATGGAGTIALTLFAAVGMGGFLTLYLVNKKKNKKEED